MYQPFVYTSCQYGCLEFTVYCLLLKDLSAASVCFSKLNQTEEEQICDYLRNLREIN